MSPSILANISLYVLTPCTGNTENMKKKILVSKDEYRKSEEKISANQR